MLDQTRLALYMHMKYGGTKTAIIQTTSLLIAARWLWHSIGICTLPIQNRLGPNGGVQICVRARSKVRCASCWN